MKRLKNIEKNQDKNNNDNDKSESSTKTLANDDDELERDVYYPDLANILESKNETKTFFTYLKGKLDEFIKLRPSIFDSDLKFFFKDIASEEKEKSTGIYFREKFLYRLGSILVFCMSIMICLIFGLIY